MSELCELATVAGYKCLYLRYSTLLALLVQKYAMLSFDYSSFIETLVLYLFYTEEFPAKLAAAIDLEIAEAERDVAGFVVL